MTRSQTQPAKPPTGLMRWFFRMPIILYQWNLGWVLGNRFILLQHVGRKSGLPREAVVEVVRHDSATNTFIIASGYGEQAQWFQNLMHRPEITIQSGRRNIAVQAKRLPLDEATAELVRYGRDHHRAAKTIGRFLGLEWNGSPEQAPAVAVELPIIALRPR